MKFYFIASVLLVLVSASVQALDSQDLEIRGFGTAGYKQSSSKYFLYDFNVDGNKPNYTDLTRFGLNFHSNLNAQWDAVVQIESKGGQIDFESFVDCGFIGWRPSGNFSLRAGRLRVPLWLYSQQLDIGLSYVWVELPAETYGLTSSIKSGNGLSMLTKNSVGPGDLVAELMVWEAKSKADVGTDDMPQTARFRAKNAIAAELAYEIQNRWLFRAAYARAKTSAQIDILTAVPPQTNPATLMMMSQTLDMDVGEFSSAGIKYDSERFLGSAEWVSRKIQGTSLTKASAITGMLGINMAKWTAYGAYSQVLSLEGTDYHHPDSDYAITNVTRTGGNTSTLGLNFHINESTIWKSQINRSNLKYSDSSANFQFNTLLVALDFVF